MSTTKQHTSASGLEPHTHYASQMSPLRAELRSFFLSIHAREQVFLQVLQSSLRHPLLDAYFLQTSNLGTHTAYVIALPLLSWYGYTDLARQLTVALALGVFGTNVVKDFLCLPRPTLVERIWNKRTTHDREYGLPSTHAANAMSVFALVTAAFPSSRSAMLVYLLTLVFGRLYCGMHGVMDLVFGMAIGRLAAAVPSFTWLITDSAPTVLLLVPAVIALLLFHPIPVEMCPCFDDGAAFLAVVAGEFIGDWDLAQHRQQFSKGPEGGIPYVYSGVLNMVARFLVGSVLILVWRSIMKKVLRNALGVSDPKKVCDAGKCDKKQDGKGWKDGKTWVTFGVYLGVGWITTEGAALVFGALGI